jgi:hypothetical protein
MVLSKTEEISHRIYPVIIISESAAVNTKWLVEIRNEESGINLFGSLAGRCK